MGGSSPKGTNADAVDGVNIGTSCYGKPVPIVYGTARVAPNHIWMPRQLWREHAGASGGKGGGSPGGQTTYTQGAMSAICEGPITGILRAWRDKDVFAAYSDAEAMTLLLGARAQTPWSYLTTLHPEDRSVQITVAGQVGGGLYDYTLTDPLFSLFTGLFWGVPRGGGPMTVVTVDPTSPSQVKITGNVLRFYRSPYVGYYGAGGDYQVTIKYRFTGDYGAAAIGYGGTALVASSAWDLGSSNAMKNYSYEVQGFFSAATNASPADIIFDLLTNTTYGCGLPAASVNVETGTDGLVESGYRRYCEQAGFSLSQVISEQRPTLDHIREILRASNADVVTSAGTISVVPMGDVAIGTYAPANQIRYALTDDHFVVGSPTDDPVSVERASQADTFNSIPVEFVNRTAAEASSAYVVSIAEEKIDADVVQTGLRKDSAVKLHGITNEAHARKISALLSKRSLYVRNTYTFRLDRRFALLEPLDLVSLTNAHLGLSAAPVRVRSVEEDKDGTLTVVAVEWPFGVAGATTYTVQAGDGGGQDTNADPLNANQPIIFAAPLVSGQTPELWIGATGLSATWGGAEVWLSWDDGASFAFAGEITGSTYGLVSVVALNGGPPVDDAGSSGTLRVDLSSSNGTIASVLKAERDANASLCVVGGEIVAFQASLLNGDGTYSLTKLRRGLKGTASNVHNIGEQFMRLDDHALRVPIDARRFGSTVLVKLVSFNLGKKHIQDPSLVTMWSYVLPSAAKAITTKPAPFVDTFDRFDINEWDVNVAGSAGTAVVVDGAGVDGGAVLQATGRISIYARTNIPINADRTYRLTIRYRQTVDDATSNAIAWGLVGVAANGTTLVSLSGANTLTPFHMKTAAPTVAGGWIEETFYMKGSAATGTVPGTYAAPGKWHNNTRYARVLLWPNDSGTTGEQQIDSITFAEADPVAVSAATDAGTAIASAGTAITLANGRNRVWYSATAPTNPMGGSNLLTGDLWFSADTTTNCVDSNCKGHTINASGVVNVGAYPHRCLYWPHVWNGAWFDGQGQQQIIAAEIVAGAITAAKIAADALVTTGYTNSGTAGAADEIALTGAKMQRAGTGASAILTCRSGLKVGALTLEQMFASMGCQNNFPLVLPGSSAIWKDVRLGANAGGVMFAVGTNVAARSNTDGRTWTAATIPAGAWVSVDGGTNAGDWAVAVGTNIACNSNNGGVTYTARTIAAGTWISLAYNKGNTYLALNGATNATTFAKSVDNGATWTTPAMPTAGVAGKWTCLAHDGMTRWVAVGTNGTSVVWTTSTDAGVTWSAVVALTPAMTDVAPSICVTRSGVTVTGWAIFTSGTSWWTSPTGAPVWTANTKSSWAPTATYSRVIQATSFWGVMGSFASNSSVYLFYSFDGSTWLAADVPWLSTSPSLAWTADASYTPASMRFVMIGTGKTTASDPAGAITSYSAP